jgi:hypothetical protein
MAPLRRRQRTSLTDRSVEEIEADAVTASPRIATMGQMLAAPNWVNVRRSSYISPKIDTWFRASDNRQNDLPHHRSALRSDNLATVRMPWSRAMLDSRNSLIPRFQHSNSWNTFRPITSASHALSDGAPATVRNVSPSQYRSTVTNVSGGNNDWRSVTPWQTESEKPRRLSPLVASAESLPNLNQGSVAVSATLQNGTPSTGLSRDSGRSVKSILHIDGAALGRWTLDHMTRTLSKPSMGLTCVDPRAAAPRSRVAPF